MWLTTHQVTAQFWIVCNGERFGKHRTLGPALLVFTVELCMRAAHAAESDLDRTSARFRYSCPGETA